MGCTYLSQHHGDILAALKTVTEGSHTRGRGFPIPLSRIFVRDGNRIVPVPLANMERAQDADDYVTLHSAGKDWRVARC